MKYKKLLYSAGLFSIITLIVVSCSKDAILTNPPLPGRAANASFVEEFDTVGKLTSKGWVFTNNSFPIGQSGWRQGRYEPSSAATIFSPLPFFGFPAYSARNTPNDFVSCDITAGNDYTTGTASISAWLISPQLPMKNGDSITFYTRAIFDRDAGLYGGQYYILYRDRMQVRANFTDGTANVGGSSTSVGSFTTVLSDVNSTYAVNLFGGYPEAWTRVKVVLSNIPGDSVRTGRFAFRYMSNDAGTTGGNSGANFPGVVGVDSLAFGRK